MTGEFKHHNNGSTIDIALQIGIIYGESMGELSENFYPCGANMGGVKGFKWWCSLKEGSLKKVFKTPYMSVVYFMNNPQELIGSLSCETYVNV